MSVYFFTNTLFTETYRIGYTGMRETARKIFGSAVIDETSDVLGLDPEGEIRGAFRPIGHEALWYAAGAFPESRFLGRFLVRTDYSQVALCLLISTRRFKFWSGNLA